jgi:hypothetical protein
MEETLVALRKKCVIGFVGGSDLSKQVEQLGPNGTCLSKPTSFLLLHDAHTSSYVER